jgi:hypothetical protein
MNAANKSSGLLHRKSFSENLLAFAIFRKRHPDACVTVSTIFSMTSYRDMVDEFMQKSGNQEFITPELTELIDKLKKILAEEVGQSSFSLFDHPERQSIQPL